MMPAGHLTISFCSVWRRVLGRYLSRPYGRVDRPKLKRRLLERCIASGVLFHCSKVMLAMTVVVVVDAAAAVQRGLALETLLVLPQWTAMLTSSTCLSLPRPPAHSLSPQAKDVRHGGGRSVVECEGQVCASGSLVLDATGHSRQFVEYDKPFNPGGVGG